MDQELFERVRDLIAEEWNLPEGDVRPDAEFVKDLGADSLALVELVMAFEEKFEIDNIPDEDMEGIRTVQDAVDYIAERKKPQKGG